MGSMKLWDLCVCVCVFFSELFCIMFCLNMLRVIMFVYTLVWDLHIYTSVVYYILVDVYFFNGKSHILSFTYVK